MVTIFDKDEACLSLVSRFVEFEVGGWVALIIFPPVVIAKEGDVEIALLDFFQIDCVWGEIGSREISLEEEGGEKSA